MPLSEEQIALPSATEDEYVDEQDPAVRGHWQITDLGSVDWALSRLGECEQEAEQIEAQERAAIAAIEARAAKLKARAARGAAFFRLKLAIWAEHNPDMIHQGQKKSRSFLHGSVGTRKKGGKLVVLDRSALVAWIREQAPEKGLFRIKVEPEMAEVQKLYQHTGEIPPGTDLDPERDDIEIKAERLSTAIKPAVKE